MVGMTKDWIYAETRAGRIPHVSLGRYYRYRPESIDAWLREIERGSVRAQHAVERR
jgi:excisionase family DNA binding protein